MIAQVAFCEWGACGKRLIDLLPLGGSWQREALTDE
jgi:hypothetical protein